MVSDRAIMDWYHSNKVLSVDLSSGIISCLRKRKPRSDKLATESEVQKVGLAGRGCGGVVGSLSSALASRREHIAYRL